MYILVNLDIDVFEDDVVSFMESIGYEVPDSISYAFKNENVRIRFYYDEETVIYQISV